MNGKLHFDFVQNFGLCAGDIADIHLGTIKDTEDNSTHVLLKIARSEEDTDLLKNEAAILKDLAVKLKQDAWSYCVPSVLDSFKIEGNTSWMNVLEFFTGFFSVEDIRKLITGVDGKTLVWMWKRLLTLLSWVHHYGYIHGAILPPHLMYFPDDPNSKEVERDQRSHSVRLVDWCYAIDYKKQSKLAAWVPEYADFYPPEVIKKQRVGPATDLYMAAMTMIYLTGGNVATKKFPSSIPAKLAASIYKCLNADPKQRPQNHGEYYDSFVKTAEEVYGKRKFHKFELPI